MAEVQEQTTSIRTSAELRNSPFGKTQKRFIREGRSYTAEYRMEDGGGIGSRIFHGRAAITQAFGFDEKGELNRVIVEQRLLDRVPADADDGTKLYEEQIDQDTPPVYRSVLVRQSGGKFAVDERISTGDVTSWNEEYVKFKHDYLNYSNAKGR